MTSSYDGRVAKKWFDNDDLVKSEERRISDVLEERRGEERRISDVLEERRGELVMY